MKGDISGLKPEEKTKYYNLFCKSLRLNPITQPFQIIVFKEGKETLYATKDCTEQLRKINRVSVTDSQSEIKNDILIVTVKGMDKTGRIDCSTGAINIKGLVENDLANAIMKAETKAKRRLTLSICGLGMLDETEIETIPGAVKKVNDVMPKKNYTDDQATHVNKKLNDQCKYLNWKTNQINEFIGDMIGKKKTIENITTQEKELLSDHLSHEMDKEIQKESAG